MFRYALIAVFLASPSIAPAAEPPLSSGSPAGQAECVRKIDLHDFGGMVARFGQLDGDDRPDAVFVQTVAQQITWYPPIFM